MDSTKLLENNFSDLYINSNKDFYISDERFKNSLKKIEPADKEKFYDALISTPHKERSYAMTYEGTSFRIENVLSTTGEVYCLRRIPKSVPNIHNLNFDHRLVQYLLSLASHSGLILWGGSTGAGKTTAISALLAEYLNLQGGFAYTIEDPAEMPLDGEYKSFNGSIGFCKQTEVIKDDWETPLKSALRSKPKYILIGEIRTPEAARECLRASISGHLVLTTIHANSITDAIGSLVKYAGYAMPESSAYDILSRGILGVLNQELYHEDTNFYPKIDTLFANPEVNEACQIRSIIRSGKLNLATAIERQAIKMSQGKPLF